MTQYLILFIFNIIIITASALQCPTCSGETCQKLDIPILECNENSGKLTYGYLRNSAKSSKVTCASFQYQIQTKVIPVRQCLYFTPTKNVCKDISLSLPPFVKLSSCKYQLSEKLEFSMINHLISKAENLSLSTWPITPTVTRPPPTTPTPTRPSPTTSTSTPPTTSTPTPTRPPPTTQTPTRSTPTPTRPTRSTPTPTRPPTSIPTPTEPTTPNTTTVLTTETSIETGLRLVINNKNNKVIYKDKVINNNFIFNLKNYN